MIESLFRISAGVVGGFALFLYAFALVADGENGDSQTIAIERDAVPYYRELASELGLDYDREYGYTDWADTKRENDLGTGGQYEFLDCSNGMLDTTGMCDYSASSEYWESVYYSNYDTTVLFRVRSEGSHSYVQLLKLAEGRRPNLHNS